MYSVLIDDNNRVAVDNEHRVCRQERESQFDLSRCTRTRTVYRHRWVTVEVVRQGIGQEDAEYQARCYARKYSAEARNFEADRLEHEAEMYDRWEQGR